MKFLNKKEQVLQIELTQYGKRLLSHGKFDPQFYAFFDDNILYDSEFAGVSEHQNEVKDRVTKDTPQLDAQYVFRSIEEDVRKVNDMDSEASELHSLSSPLGTSAIEKENAPAWSIKVLRGNIKSASKVITGSYPTALIPQINVDPIVYRYEIVEGDELPRPSLQADRDAGDPIDAGGPNQEGLDELSSQLGLGESELVEQFDDGNYLSLYDDSIILEIEELNTDLDKENFDIEVYEVTTENTSDKIGSDKQVLTPLFFSKDVEYVRNDILLDEEEVYEDDNVSENDPNYVEYFFNVRVDREIEELALSRVESDKAADLYKSISEDADKSISEDADELKECE